MISFKKILVFIFVSLLAGIIWWILLLFNTFPKKTYLNDTLENPNEIGIIVLTGGKHRIEKGVDLLARGHGKKLFISGVFMPSEVHTKFSLEKEKSELFKCCVFFGEKAKNTLENALEVEKWLMQNKEIKSIILVSSYYHLPRSMIIFEKKISSKIKIFPIPAVYRKSLDSDFFFHVKLIISEYFKIIYTLIFV